MANFAILVPILWLVAIVLLIVLEAVTYQLVAIWFALGAAAALSFVDCWNMVEQPLIYLANHTNLQPLSVMFNQISTDRADVAFAGSALYILPTLLIYLYFQEDIVAGIQLSELK